MDDVYTTTARAADHRFEFEFEFDLPSDMVLIDITMETGLYDTMRYELDPIDPTTVEIGLYNVISCAINDIDVSKVEIVFCCIMSSEIVILSFILNGMALVIDNLIKILSLVLILDTLAIIYNAIDVHLAKKNQIGCINCNGSNATMIVIDIEETNCARLEIIFFLNVILQTIDASLPNITVSNEFVLFIIAIVQLDSNLTVLLLFGAIDCGTQVTHNVCCVSYYVCLFFCFFEFAM